METEAFILALCEQAYLEPPARRRTRRNRMVLPAAPAEKAGTSAESPREGGGRA